MAPSVLIFQVSLCSRVSKSLIDPHSFQSLKIPRFVGPIQCSASSSDSQRTLRTCRNCKTQFDPLLNHPRACRFHTAHFGGETKRKFESVYSGGTMDTPNSGKVLQYWHCCGSEDPFDSGYHLVLVVDRLSSDSGLGTVNRAEPKADTVNKDCTSESVSAGTDICESNFVQCRICHDEDEDSNMDTPCSCSGTLRFAHSDCVQRWCNEKGDTVCEICCQQYNPGYTAPRLLFHYTGISMNMRSNWGTEGLDLHNPYFLTWDVASDHELYSIHSPTSLIYCRLIALLFILLLVLRHSLPFFLGGMNYFSLPLLMLPFLRTLAILLVVYFFSKAFTAIQRCRQERDVRFSSFSSSEEPPWTRMSIALPEEPELHAPVN